MGWNCDMLQLHLGSRILTVQIYKQHSAERNSTKSSLSQGPSSVWSGTPSNSRRHDRNQLLRHNGRQYPKNAKRKLYLVDGWLYKDNWKAQQIAVYIIRSFKASKEHSISGRRHCQIYDAISPVQLATQASRSSLSTVRKTSAVL